MISGYTRWEPNQLTGTRSLADGIKALKEGLRYNTYLQKQKDLVNSFRNQPDADIGLYWQAAEALKPLVQKQYQVNPFDNSVDQPGLSFKERWALKYGPESKTKVQRDAQGNVVVSSEGKNVDPNSIYQQNTELRNKFALTEDEKKLATQKMMLFDEADFETQRNMLKDTEIAALKNRQKIKLDKGIFNDEYVKEDMPLNEWYKKVKPMGWHIPEGQFTADIEQMRGEGISDSKINLLIQGHTIVKPDGQSVKINIKNSKDYLGATPQSGNQKKATAKDVETYIAKYGDKAKEMMIKDGYIFD